MSFSSIIRESQDPRRRLVRHRFQHAVRPNRRRCTSVRCPATLAGIRDTLQGGEMAQGDLVIHNHPYHGSSHSPDIAVVVPVFHEGTLVGFSANTAHHLDIGAATPGLIIDIPDVFAEGMLFAGTKLLRARQAQRGAVGLYRPQQPRRAPAAGRPRRADRLGAARRQALRRADGTLRAADRVRRDGS